LEVKIAVLLQKFGYVLQYFASQKSLGIDSHKLFEENNFNQKILPLYLSLQLFVESYIHEQTHRFVV